MLLCLWSAFTARMHERTSWWLLGWLIPRSTISDPSWRPSSLPPLELQMESTWMSLLCLPALHKRGKKLLSLIL